jgi:alkylhydroperoxidase family enzyme
VSFVKQVQNEEAPELVRRIFEAGQKQYGLVFNNWRVFAQSPELLRPFAQFIGAVTSPTRLSKRTFELAVLKTSLLNQCNY